MTLDERIRRHLEESTAALKAPDRLDEVMAEGRRRNIRRGTFTVLGVAAAVAAVVTFVPLLLPEGGMAPVDSIPATTSGPAPSTTAPAPEVGAARPLGVLIVGDGLTVLDTEGSPTLELERGDVMVAYPDQTGGIVYQEEAASGGYGPIHRLTSDGSSVLAGAPGDATVVPIGPGRLPSGEPLFLYLDGTLGQNTVMAFHLASGEADEVTGLPPYTDVTAGAGLLAMVDRSDSSCPTLVLFHLERGEIPSPLPDDCLPAAAGVSVSPEGDSLGILAGETFRVIAVDDGEVRLDLDVPGAYMATAGPGGWVIRTPDETVLLATDGQTWSLPPVGPQDWVVPYATPFDPAAGEMPDPADASREACAEGTLPEQSLPDDVASTRSRLWELASACDAAGLADLARADETVLTLGGDVDPVAFWQDQEQIRTLARLLATRPAQDPGADLWAWPAVQVDPDDEESWGEVAEIVGADLVDEMRQSGTGYTGYRVAIAADGRWQYFVGGD